jgi:hypothetical protein
MKLSRLFIALLLVIVLTSASIPAKAGSSSPWGEILNPDGTIKWSSLKDLGTTSQPASWMDLTLPGGIALNLDATYHRFQTPSGNILVLPSPATLFFMAQHPKESGLIGASSMLGDGAAILSMLLSPSLSAAQLAQIASKGFVDPKQFFQAVIDGKENIWSIVNFNYLFDIMKMSFSSGFLVNALILYINGVSNCASIPGGCSGVVQNPNGPPEASVCPAPTTSQKPAVLDIQKMAPEKPLVVGQDPAKRGADVQLSVTIPPLIFTWYQEIQDPPVCRFAGDGSGKGCAGPGSRYKAVKDANGNSISWSPSMENNPNWRSIDGAIHCIKHVDTVPEPILSVQSTATLSPESRSWILGHLASVYYGAYIHRAAFDLVPGMGQATGGCGGDGVCSAAVLIPRIPFADPGTFSLQMWVYTAGAVWHWNGMSFPISQPRTLYKDSSLDVYVTLVSLVPAGAP